MAPTDVLDRPAWKFWMDAQIRLAGAKWEQDAREKARQDGDAGTANMNEKEELAEAQERRADRREQMDGQPSIDDQLAAMNDG